MSSNDTKRKYEQPTMRIVELYCQAHLLQISGRDNYIPDDNDPFAGN